MEQQQVVVCERVAEEMGAAGYAVFDQLENGHLVSYVYANQFEAFRNSFRDRG